MLILNPMKSNNKTVNSAIKRHDLDASGFDSLYKGLDNSSKARVFMLGRNLIIEELDTFLKTLPQGAKILDVGCGTGHLTNKIKQKGYDVYGIEPSSEMLKIAKKNFPSIPLRSDISSKISFDNDYFDAIIALEVLRYLDEEENHNSLKEFHRCLKERGSFFVTQVNAFSTDFYYFFYHLKSLYSYIFKKVNHHCYFTTPRAQEILGRKCGFKSIKTIGLFFGSSRIAFKFGKKFGNSYYRFLRKISQQRITKYFYKAFCGHLVVIGKK